MESIREQPVPGTKGILSSDLSRNSSDAKKPEKSVYFKTAARKVQNALSMRSGKPMSQLVGNDPTGTPITIFLITKYDMGHL